MCPSCHANNHIMCSSIKREDTDTGVLFFCCCSAPDEGATTTRVMGPNGRSLKTEGFKDQRSTGRKRAALAAPIDKEAPCEWQGLLNAGGGVFPIIGCTDGKQKDRHHGPDKSTINNEVGVNLHRICKTCHNRWHALNDVPYYGKTKDDRPPDGQPWVPLEYECLPHDPVTSATPAQQFEAEIFWQTAVKDREIKEHEE